MQLEGLRHGQVVTGAAADQRHGGAEDAVAAAHDLLLVAGETVGEQEEHAVLVAVLARELRGDLRPGLAQTRRRAFGGGGAHLEALAAHRDDDDAGASRPIRGDLARRRAADEGHLGGLRPDAGEQLVQVVGAGGKDDEQLRIGAALERAACGSLAGRARGGLVRLADCHPAARRAVCEGVVAHQPDIGRPGRRL